MWLIRNRFPGVLGNTSYHSNCGAFYFPATPADRQTPAPFRARCGFRDRNHPRFSECSSPGPCGELLTGLGGCDAIGTSVHQQQGKREFGLQIEIRCWESLDARRAIPTRLPWETLENLSLRILDAIPAVVSVTYNIAPKPPSTMEAV